jgi:ubiquitin C-terminal hydrolase
MTDNKSSENTDIKYGVSKFQNINGITCYMNSILHILQHTPIFTEYISQLKFRDVIIGKIDNTITMSENNKVNILNNLIIVELYKLFKESLENDNKTIVPITFKKLIGKKNDMWNDMEQQDSQEFFNFLISKLQEENGLKYKFIPGAKFNNINDNINKNDVFNIINGSRQWLSFQLKEYSPLNYLFDGMTQIVKRCICCGNQKNIYEPFLTLPISIPIKNREDINKSFSIYECMDSLIQEEQLDNDNQFNCEMCGLKNKGYTHLLLWKTPKILVIHIKRFISNNMINRPLKLNNNITYPFKDFDISKYISKYSPYKDKCKYDLFGVNIHHSNGRNINYGHYTSYVKSIINNNWYLYNDSAEPINIRNENQLQTNNAYLLFYYCHN